MIKQVKHTSKWIIDQFDILLYSVFGAKIDGVNKTSYNVYYRACKYEQPYEGFKFEIKSRSFTLWPRLGKDYIFVNNDVYLTENLLIAVQVKCARSAPQILMCLNNIDNG